MLSRYCSRSVRTQLKRTTLTNKRSLLIKLNKLVCICFRITSTALYVCIYTKWPIENETDKFLLQRQLKKCQNTSISLVGEYI